MTACIWFRSDLRVDDNTALNAALQARHERLGALYYATPEQWREHDMAAVKGEFLWRNLEHLREELGKLHIPLFVKVVPRFADIPVDLLRFAAQQQVQAVYANREYAVNETRRDRAVEEGLREAGIGWFLCDDATLLPPGRVRNRQGQPFKIFTPFKRELLALIDTAPVPGRAPKAAGPWREAPRLPAYPYTCSNVDPALWPAGEKEAVQRLQRFVESSIGAYQRQRDFPALAGTSQLSPYLALGVISIRRCVEAALMANQGQWQGGDAGVASWINELLWREFYTHVLADFPPVSMHRAMRASSENVAWRYDDADFQAWRDGKTGFPLVDAAMRQLSETGWMHNRLRMVSAMFLSKYLLLDWRLGERHFMLNLVDGDLAANNGGWQWSASTGTDAAPYFRVLNPLRQAERFDPEGAFCKRFLPQLRQLPARILLQPGHPALLATGYPAPMLDLKTARDRMLKAFSSAMAPHRKK